MSSDDSQNESLAKITDRKPLVAESWSKTYHGQADVAPSILQEEQLSPKAQDIFHKVIEFEPTYSKLFFVDPTKEYKHAYHQLTHDGWLELQARLGNISGDGKLIDTDKLAEYVKSLEVRYKGVKQQS